MSTPLSLTAASLTRAAHRVKQERHGGTFPVKGDPASMQAQRILSRLPPRPGLVTLVAAEPSASGQATAIATS
jgi:hypothetical protein